MRKFSKLDNLIDGFDNALRSICIPKARSSERASPAVGMEPVSLTGSEQRDVASLLRVNHAGEVCAQALYQGQALTAKLANVRSQMQAAADEEIDHLAWCEARLAELGSNVSILNPLWYLGSFVIGAVAGLCGDKWSLGFVAETEQQVVKHLKKHIAKLPQKDVKTLAILQQMAKDEALHAQTARNAGAEQLPQPVQSLMQLTSKFLTIGSYYV